MSEEKLREGYHIFHEVAVEDRGVKLAVLTLEAKIKEAEKDFDIVFLSGASVKDDPGAGKNAYFCHQAAVLTRKKK